MRFIWFPAASHGHSALPVAMLSVATHAAFVGVVALGHGPGQLTVSEPDEPTIYYLPPPDRVPSRHSIAERITYVEVGSGAAAGSTESPDGQRTRGLGHEEAATRGGAQGADATTQVAAGPVTFDDSVYSVLAAQESAVRVEGSAAPVYPLDMLSQGLEGFVQARYIIDTTGRADSASLEVLVASNVAFEASVRAALPGMRFIAAQVQGRKVRQLVQQEFDFRITPPAPGPVVAEHTRTHSPE